MASLNENIAQVKADFGGIKRELVNKGASIPSGTPTSQYANIIKNMSTGGSEEAYEQGRQDVIAESKYIPKSAVGKFISLTDVSEVSHKVKVVGVGNEVDVYGNNLLPYPYALNTTELYGITINTNDDRTLTISGTATNTLNLTLCTRANLVGGKIYIFDTGSTVGEPLITYEVDGVRKYHAKSSLLWDDSYTFITFGVRYVSGSITNETIYPIVYEEGTKQTITATPMGTEIPSICPIMNFISDEEIKVDYYSSYGMAEKELAMWNAKSFFGKRSDWRWCFAYSDYSGYTVPRGFIKTISAMSNMFYNYKGSELPNGLDLSMFDNTKTDISSHAYDMFNYAELIHIYDIGLPAVIYTRTYRNCSKLETIEIIRSNEQTTFDTNCFNGCISLIRCIFSGIITCDLTMFQCKKLDDESLVSISVALCDLVFSGFGDGWGSRTLTLSAESIARLKELTYPPDDLNPEGTPYAEDGASCYDVIVGRKGWNIA